LTILQFFEVDFTGFAFFDNFWVSLYILWRLSSSAGACATNTRAHALPCQALKTEKQQLPHSFGIGHTNSSNIRRYRLPRGGYEYCCLETVLNRCLLVLARLLQVVRAVRRAGPKMRLGVGRTQGRMHGRRGEFVGGPEGRRKGR